MGNNGLKSRCGLALPGPTCCRIPNTLSNHVPPNVMYYAAWMRTHLISLSFIISVHYLLRWAAAAAGGRAMAPRRGDDGLFGHGVIHCSRLIYTSRVSYCSLQQGTSTKLASGDILVKVVAQCVIVRSSQWAELRVFFVHPFLSASLSGF